MADAEHARAADTARAARPRARRARAAVARPTASERLDRRACRRRRPSPRIAAPCRCLRSGRALRAASVAGFGPLVDAELQARRAGVQDERVVVHGAPHVAACSGCRRACAASIATRAARDPRPHAVGAAGQDDRHARAEHEAGAVGVGEEAQLLGQDVAGLEVGHEQDVGIAGDLGRDALDRRRLLADRVVERQRAVEERRP